MAHAGQMRVANWCDVHLRRLPVHQSLEMWCCTCQGGVRGGLSLTFGTTAWPGSAGDSPSIPPLDPDISAHVACVPMACLAALAPRLRIRGQAMVGRATSSRLQPHRLTRLASLTSNAMSVQPAAKPSPYRVLAGAKWGRRESAMTRSTKRRPSRSCPGHREFAEAPPSSSNHLRAPWRLPVSRCCRGVENPVDRDGTRCNEARLHARRPT